MDMEEACREEIWYQQGDLQNIKRKAMIIAKESHRYGLGSLLTNTYGNTSNETQGAINTWARNGNGRRGLERWINDEYAAKRSDIRKRTIKSVLRAQRKMVEEGVDDPVYCVKVLARLSEAFSQDSRTFARVMGIADEHAKQVDCDAGQEEVELCAETKQRIPPSRQSSPHSVLIAPIVAPKRNLGLTNSHVTDMRHFY